MCQNVPKFAGVDTSRVNLPELIVSLEPPHPCRVARRHASAANFGTARNIIIVLLYPIINEGLLMEWMESGTFTNIIWSIFKVTMFLQFHLFVGNKCASHLLSFHKKRFLDDK